MSTKKSDYPTIREMTIRNNEKIEAMYEDIQEIKETLKCLVTMKQDLERHKAYFKIMGAGITALISIVTAILVKII